MRRALGRTLELRAKPSAGFFSGLAQPSAGWGRRDLQDPRTPERGLGDQLGPRTPERGLGRVRSCLYPSLITSRIAIADGLWATLNQSDIQQYEEIQSSLPGE
jgi:hypothetical protein